MKNRIARLDWYDRQIAAMEQRVLEAATIEAARAFHARLDALRDKREQERQSIALRVVAAQKGES